MYIVIIELLLVLPGFINDVEVLRDREKRKKICRDIFALEILTNKLRKNAILVKSELHELMLKLRKRENVYMYDLCYILEEQILYIREIQDILNGRHMNDSIMRVYGYDDEVFHKLISGKLSLVDMMKASVSIQNEEVPLTFDLSSYGSVNEYLGDDGKIHRHLHFDTLETLEKMADGGMRFGSKNCEELLNHLTFLYNQMEDFDSINKLEEAQNNLDIIIQKNFTLQELVGD